MELNISIKFEKEDLTDFQQAQVVQNVTDALMGQIENSENGLAPDDLLTCSFWVSDLNGELRLDRIVYTPPKNK